METTDHKGVLSITLDAECTIAKTEAHVRQLRSRVSDGLKGIEVRAGAVEEMDTAYFQMMLSLKTTAEVRGISFEMPETCSETERLCELYGVILSAAAEIG